MPIRVSPSAKPAALLGVLAALAGCQTGTPYRNPSARADPDMRAVLSRYQESGARPIHTLSVPDARSQPTMQAAYRTVMAGKVGEPFTAAMFTQVSPLAVDGAAGPLPARLYDPAPGHRAQPVILYFHGGLGASGSVDEDDDVARALAAGARAMVVSVDYRLAPENRFPAPYDDAVASYRWLLDHAAAFGGDTRRIALAGQAAGGSLALDVAVAARDGAFARPVHVLLIDPLSGTAAVSASAIRNTDAVPLDRADVGWSLGQLVSSGADLNDPRLDPLGHADLHRLPVISIVYSEMNPLQSEAKAMASKLAESGTDVRQQEYAGTTYGFFGMGAAVGRAKEAETFAAAELGGTFDAIGEPPAPATRRPQHATRARRR